jgi:hypothetical protein
MLHELQKLSRDQKGLAAILVGGLTILLALEVIPGLTTILAIAGGLLIVVGLFLLEIHRKIMGLFSKK